MEERGQIEAALRDLFAAQRLAVLSTQSGGRPHASLVAFSAAEDLRQISFATTRSTRKFDYLSADPWVALLIDSRRNRESDFHEATAATATGRAREARSGERAALLERYLAKHPGLTGFVASPTCALVVVDVHTYYVVSRFQHVVELHLEPAS